MRIARFDLQIFIIALIVMGLAGCAASYSVKGDSISKGLESGNIASAVSILEGTDPKASRDLLYYLEKGELLRTSGDYQNSQETWRSAEEIVEAWEEAAKTDPSKLMDFVGSVAVNDSARRYDGRDYEKVFLNVRMAMNHLSENDWNGARIQVKKMHEREAIIADFRKQELDKAKSQAESKGVEVSSFKELNGYPVETLNAPEVLNLRNSYESAFANYLAGFIYESLGETSLAAPGYRKAAELRPNNPAIDNALADLDRRIRLQQQAAAPKGKTVAKLTKSTKPDVSPASVAPEAPAVAMVDTLIVVEAGMVPAIKSQQISIPLLIPSQSGLTPILTAISWPVIYPDYTGASPSTLQVDGVIIPVTELADLNAMARKAISDEMPGIIARSTTRAITRAIAQKAVDDNVNNMGSFGLLASLATKVASVATENADERVWRSLPRTFSVARRTFAPGSHSLKIATASGEKEVNFTTSGTHSLIDIRLVSDQLYLMQSMGSEIPLNQTAEDSSILSTTRDKSIAN